MSQNVLEWDCRLNLHSHPDKGKDEQLTEHDRTWKKVKGSEYFHQLLWMCLMLLNYRIHKALFLGSRMICLLLQLTKTAKDITSFARLLPP